ncbi:MAG: alpha/beta fold hydrolase [Granulosicoccaceae bacterium]
MKPLVFVHGFMGGSEQWALQAPLGRERELICLDLPGFGKNAHLEPVTSIAGYGAWVLQELAQRGVHRFDLLGHSMGGMIVQEVVAQSPERVNKLVLYGTGPRGVMPGRFETIEVSMQRSRDDGPQKTARRIAATWFLQREAADQFAACAEIAEQSSLGAMLAGLAAMKDWSGESYLASIAAKTLILWGDEDRAYAWPQVQTLWQSIPDCQLAVVPACSHAVHMENPSLFNQLVDEFLSTN